MSVSKEGSSPTNVLVVGVGGQGVIMVSRILARICQLQGLQVKQSEVHGMAKRGGSVFSHVRFGGAIWSPTIPKGQADILLALEWAEGLRWLNFLKPESGTFIADTQHIVPPFACLDRRRGARSGYAPETPADIVAMVPRGFALDATRIADELGDRRVANSVLLGSMSTALDFPLADWEAVLSQMVPPKTREVNRQAFAQGREWMRRVQEDPEAMLPEASAQPLALEGEGREGVRLEIVEAWCKGCDICVKMCPERCLVLNSRQIVELVDPAACTGCRICEWLCPDLAIMVHKEPLQAVSA